MNIKHKQFFIKYKTAFFITKFLVRDLQKLFILKFIRYNVDINKYSLLNIFWVCFLLFGQLPKIKFYTKQITDKLTHGSLVITQKFSNLIFYIYKLINFFLLTSATEVVNIKTKNTLDNFKLGENSYYPELSHFPRFFVNPFGINVYLAFHNNYSLSLLEKVTLFRILQLPINLGFIQQKIKRKRFVYKKTKINKIK
jgi:hypothetical protein